MDTHTDVNTYKHVQREMSFPVQIFCNGLEEEENNLRKEMRGKHFHINRAVDMSHKASKQEVKSYITVQFRQLYTVGRDTARSDVGPHVQLSNHKLVRTHI